MAKRKKIEKAIVTQDNRFIYSKYDMNTNELKFFMYIISQLNSIEDKIFKECSIPLSEIFDILQHKSKENFTYIKNLIDNMARKIYIEDFKLLDEKTMKKVDIHQATALFNYVRYKKNDSHIIYKLNDTLVEYLLTLKQNFTQLKFLDIQEMKSAYSIRIYNMLLCELKQNKTNLKINVGTLQNILDVPPSLTVFKDFDRRVLQQATKDINEKSNLVLLEIKRFKTGRKITEIEFIFDYKNNENRIKRDELKVENFNKHIKKIIDENYLYKELFSEKLGTLFIESCTNSKKDGVYIIASKKDNSNLKYKIPTRNFTELSKLEKAKKRAEELFYLDEKNIKIIKKRVGKTEEKDRKKEVDSLVKSLLRK